MNLMNIPDLPYELMEMFKVEIVELIKTLKNTNCMTLINRISQNHKDSQLFSNALNVVNVENDALLEIIGDFILYSMT